MDSNLVDPSPYPTPTVLDVSGLPRNAPPAHKRKRDSVDGELSSERSTQRLHTSAYPDPQEFIAPDYGHPQDEPGFFVLDQSQQREANMARATDAQMAMPEPARAVEQYGVPGLSPTRLDELRGGESPHDGPERLRGIYDPPVAKNGRDMHHVDGVEGFGSPPLGKRSKATVGSDEWHRDRKNNHKEVERRRRETINEGISAISSLLPTHNEKNKGSILSNAAAYILKLRDEKDALADKWASEKVVVDESIREFMRRLEHMHQVAEAWKGLAREAGVDVDGEMERRAGGGGGGLVIEEVPTREDVEGEVVAAMGGQGRGQGQGQGHVQDQGQDLGQGMGQGHAEERGQQDPRTEAVLAVAAATTSPVANMNMFDVAGAQAEQHAHAHGHGAGRLALVEEKYMAHGELEG